MSQQGPEGPGDPLGQVAEVSLRLMAGVVSRRLMETLQRTIRQNPVEYPWQVVNRAVLVETVDPERLLQQGLRAQRDWIGRGGREAPGPVPQVRAKAMLAMVLARVLFFAVYTAAVVVLLILVKQKWPSVDIYRLLSWLQSALPGVFPPPG